MSSNDPTSPANLPLFAHRGAARPAARRLGGSSGRQTLPPVHPATLPARLPSVPPASPAATGGLGAEDLDGTVFSPRAAQLSLEDHARVDWRAVNLIRKAVSERIKVDLEDALSRAALTRADHGHTAARLISEEIVTHNQRRLSRGEPALQRAEQLLLQRAVDDSIFGLGRIQALLDLPGLENLLIAGYDNVRLEFGDGRILTGVKVAESNQELIELITHVAETMSGGTRSFSTAACVLNMALPDGSRLAAATRIHDVPRISIRVHQHIDVDLDGLYRDDGMLDQGLHSLLTAGIRARLNIVISGLPSAGKTTMARSILHQLPPTVHIGTIETKYELFLHRTPERHHFVTRLQELAGNGESTQQQYDVNALVPIMLQHSPERIAVGELLGPEILALFKALQSTKGSISTVHSDNASDAIERMVTLLTEVGPQVTERHAYRQVAQHIDLIVHVDSIDQRGINGGRRHRFISEVTAPALNPDGADRGISNEQLYKPGPDGRAIPTGKRPDWADRLIPFGFDPNRWLNPGTETWAAPLDLMPVTEIAV